jgi:Excreted virulence factor EspC, type VII ESX diderm
MSGGFVHVTPEDLHSHSEEVDTVAEGIDEAASAAGTERAGGMVYGVLFDALAQPFLNMWADHIQDLIQKNGELGHAIAEGIKANAQTYDGIEKHNNEKIKSVGGGGGGGSW